jgi:hypothetical protein
MAMTDPRRAAEALVDHIMSNILGQRADRLVLMSAEPDARDIGGWSRAPLIDLVLAYGGQCAAEARAERDDARGLARILAHAWRHDACPPEHVVSQALRFPVRPAPREALAEAWQPIETAPPYEQGKGQRGFLVWVPDNRCTYMVRRCSNGKFGIWGMQADDVLVFQPTHWQPLLAPPSARTDAEEQG